MDTKPKKKSRAKKSTTAVDDNKVEEIPIDEENVEETKPKRKSRAKKSTKADDENKVEEIPIDGENIEETKPKRKSRAKKSTEEQGTPSNKSNTDIVSKPVKRSNRKPTIPPEINIGTAGHVDEGKSTLIQLLTGKFPDEHSEELKRGITIRLGYADCDVLKCPKCPDPECWTIYDECPTCNSETSVERRVSFVDAPGHEILMQVMLSGAALMDGVMLVISANNKVPQPQTREHLAALTALGITNIIVVQNKVELVSEEQAMQNYRDIKKFLKGTIAENAPVIPMSAMHGANLDVLISALQKFIPTPKRNPSTAAQMMVARSFDINKPGTKPKNLKGGVLGGSLLQGKLEVGSTISILPGLKRKKDKSVEYIPIRTQIKSIQIGAMGTVKEAYPGGLLAIQTTLDPSMARSDNLAGNIVSAIGHEPPVIDEITLLITLFDNVVGSEIQESVKPLKKGEPILLTSGTATAVGSVINFSKNQATFQIKPIIALNDKIKIALSRRFGKRWRLIGWGEIHEHNQVEISFKD